MKRSIEIKKELMRVFDEIAEEFDVKRTKPWPEAEKLLELKLVLDIGAGSGRHALYLARHGLEVVAADLSKRMMGILSAKARKMGLTERIHVVCCDACNLPFRDGAFDGVLSLATIHHIPSKGERLKAVVEAKRVLKLHGMVVVSVWAVFQPRFFKKLPGMFVSRILGKVESFGDVYIPWKSRKGVFNRFHHLFTRRELLKLVKEAGLKVREAYGRSFTTRFFAENHVIIAEKI